MEIELDVEEAENTLKELSTFNSMLDELLDKQKELMDACGKALSPRSEDMEFGADFVEPYNVLFESATLSENNIKTVQGAINNNINVLREYIGNVVGADEQASGKVEGAE